MRLARQRLLSALCALLGLTFSSVQAGDEILNAIPSDALGFAVVHNLADASRGMDDLAKLVQAPAPDLLRLAKTTIGIQQGLDEAGDVALVLTGIEPEARGVVLVPVDSFAEFFAAFNVEEQATGIVEVQVAGVTRLVGRHGNYAAIAAATDRETLEKFLASTTNLASDNSLADWLNANQASIVVTSRGVKELLPKATDGIRSVQQQLRQMGGEQAQPTADALNLYVDIFTAAEPEIEQFAIGLRIDTAKTVSVVKRARFTGGGAWAQWAANSQAASQDLLAGFPAGPFVFAFGGILPKEPLEHLMTYSVQMMQSQPQFKLTPEQSQKYASLSIEAMRGVHSMGMMMGVAEPGTGLYGNTSLVMNIDDSQDFFDRYEASLAAMREFAKEAKSPGIPVATTRRIQLGDMEALEVSMKFADFKQLMIAPPGAPDMQKMMQYMFGSKSELKVYIAWADEHTVIAAYTSVERLKATIDFYNSKQPGLSGEIGLAKVAATLPAGSQMVAYTSLGGIAKVVQQMAALIPGLPATMIPDFPESPPIGMAVKVSPAGAEGQLSVTAETLQAIGEVIAQVRGRGVGTNSPPKLDADRRVESKTRQLSELNP